MHVQLQVYIAFWWAKRAPFEIRCFCHKNILKLFCIIFMVKKCNLQFWLFRLQTYCFGWKLFKKHNKPCRIYLTLPHCYMFSNLWMQMSKLWTRFSQNSIFRVRFFCHRRAELPFCMCDIYRRDSRDSVWGSFILMTGRPNKNIILFDEVPLTHLQIT